MRHMEQTRNSGQYTEGYFFVVDADGAEVPGSRRAVNSDMPWDKVFAIREELERGLGADCSVEFREV